MTSDTDRTTPVAILMALAFVGLSSCATGPSESDVQSLLDAHFTTAPALHEEWMTLGTVERFVGGNAVNVSPPKPTLEWWWESSRFPATWHPSGTVDVLVRPTVGRGRVTDESKAMPLLGRHGIGVRGEYLRQQKRYLFHPNPDAGEVLNLGSETARVFLCRERATFASILAIEESDGGRLVQITADVSVEDAPYRRDFWHRIAEDGCAGGTASFKARIEAGDDGSSRSSRSSRSSDNARMPCRWSQPKMMYTSWFSNDSSTSTSRGEHTVSTISRSSRWSPGRLRRWNLVPIRDRRRLDKRPLVAEPIWAGWAAKGNCTVPTGSRSLLTERSLLPTPPLTPMMMGSPLIT